MKQETIHTEEYKGHTINIFRDEYPQGPDDWDDSEIFLVYDHRNFCVNRKGYEPEEINEHIQNAGRNFYEGYHVFPVYAYIHSGISLSLGRTGYPFTCPWDTSMRGFILVKRLKGWSYSKKQAFKQAQGLIDTWNDYLSGNVYGFEVLDKNGEHIDSCWGFYGDYDGEYGALSEARSAVNSQVKYSLKKHLEQVKVWIKNKVPFINRKSFEYSI